MSKVRLFKLTIGILLISINAFLTAQVVEIPFHINPYIWDSSIYQANPGHAYSTAGTDQINFLTITGNKGASHKNDITASPSRSSDMSAAIISGATYTILAKHSGKALEVADASMVNKANVRQWDYNGGNHQKWTVTNVGVGDYKIVAKHSGKVLNVHLVSLLNGGEVTQWDYIGANQQKWKIINVGGDYYKVIAKHSGKALNVNGISNANGADVNQWTYTGAAHQQWQFIRGNLWIPAETTTDVDSDKRITVFALHQNTPNPFNPTTQIQYSLPKPLQVTLKVYNILGAEVATLVSGTQPAGTHTANFDASYLSSGIYFYRLQAGHFVAVKSMMLVR